MAAEPAQGLLKLNDQSSCLLTVEGKGTGRQHDDGPTPGLQLVVAIHGYRTYVRRSSGSTGGQIHNISIITLW